jgi:uncharacterized protein YbjT (DUF2867 family)
MKVLVTGGTGDLGRPLTRRLADAGYEVRVLSRQADPDVPEGVEAARGDLAEGSGIAEAVAGVDVIAHCATGARDAGIRGLFGRGAVRKADVDATPRLLEQAKAAGGPHIVYISIVGIDKIPLGYYRVKLEVENQIISSGLPYTIFRTTQWHTLAWEFGTRLSRGPLIPNLRGFKVQLLDPGEVAERMVDLVGAGPSGRADDTGGPEVLEFSDVLRSYLKATGKRRGVLPMVMPGKTARAFREGHNLAPDHADGKITWQQWLDNRTQQPAP